MGLFDGPTPKKHRVWSNDYNLIAALLERAGTMPKALMDTFTTKLVDTYVDRNGVKRRVGKKKELKASQTLVSSEHFSFQQKWGFNASSFFHHFL